jgi:CheY-like chemotaxis protein/AraC-like DNA-binding protein
VRQVPRSSGLPTPQVGLKPRGVVLVVDDDAGVREALHLILDDEYAVLDATHGRTALAIVQARRVDLVLLDVLMPEVDGIEILQELKAVEPDLPVIIITAVKTITTSVAAMKLGAYDYITKPFCEEVLVATIRRAFEQRARQSIARVQPAKHGGNSGVSRTHRLLIVGGDLGWRATLTVALARLSTVETSPTLIDGLNRVIRFRPTGVILNVGQASAEAVRFLRALHAQLPACPVLVVSEDGYLGGVSEAWEALNIRSVVRSPSDAGDLLSRIGFMACQGIDTAGTWPRLGASVSQAIHCISTRFNEGLTVDSLAQLTDISGSRLAHLFRTELGTSVRSYLTRVRVAIAQDLLAHSDQKLEAIASRLGFYDMFHLSRVFQKVAGKPPSAYRRSVS